MAVSMPQPPAPTKSPSARLIVMALGCAAVGAVLVASIAVGARGCRGGSRVDNLEQRVARIEGTLGIAEAGPAASGDASAPAASGVASAGPEITPPCAIARVKAYEAWQDALTRAKALAGPAEAACNDMWSDRKKQACYYSASATVRAAQAARDTVIKGGAPAKDAVKNVKDDAKNEALAPAVAASQAAFAACGDDNEL